MLQAFFDARIGIISRVENAIQIDEKCPNTGWNSRLI